MTYIPYAPPHQLMRGSTGPIVRVLVSKLKEAAGSLSVEIPEIRDGHENFDAEVAIAVQTVAVAGKFECNDDKAGPLFREGLLGLGIDFVDAVKTASGVSKVVMSDTKTIWYYDPRVGQCASSKEAADRINAFERY